MKIGQKLLFIAIVLSLFTTAFAGSPQDTVPSALQDKETLNKRFNELYLINFPVSYAVPFVEANVPYKRWYILNSDVRVPFNLFPKYWRTSFIAVARFKVRIIGSERSAPVRTPSFLPGAVFNIRLNNNFNRFKYLSFEIFHHSNGQDGPAVYIPGTDDINLFNGNFSTNFLCANYHFGTVSDYRLVSHKIGVEGHWNNEHAFKKYLGQARVNYTFQYSTSAIKWLIFRTKVKKEEVFVKQIKNDEELWRWVANATVMLNNLHGSAAHYFNLELMGIRKISGSPNAGFFGAIGWCGHDDYNVFFRQPYFFARAGFVFTPGFRYGLTHSATDVGKSGRYFEKKK